MVLVKMFINKAGIVITQMFRPSDRNPPWANRRDCKSKAGAMARTACWPRSTPISPFKRRCVFGPPGIWIGKRLVRKKTAVKNEIFGMSLSGSFLPPRNISRNAIPQPMIIPVPRIKPSGRCTANIGSIKSIC